MELFRKGGRENPGEYSRRGRVQREVEARRRRGLRDLHAENVHWNRISAAPTEEYLSPQVKMKLQSSQGSWPQQTGDWPQPMEAVTLQFHRPAEDSGSQDPRMSLPCTRCPPSRRTPPPPPRPTVIPKQPSSSLHDRRTCDTLRAESSRYSKTGLSVSNVLSLHSGK
ncbi:fibronectin type-III domain-containing protein [Caerostris extrusa]|uniref:Fibronectin type-III domain-containing protein n=1 Tax=Caerostris extrusa TaxID=172846 RepID=A0AAV4XWT6_CAEEX|nr:fibronectin type-III domain-containing protein [Caerostris extrusa]